MDRPFDYRSLSTVQQYGSSVHITIHRYREYRIKSDTLRAEGVSAVPIDRFALISVEPSSVSPKSNETCEGVVAVIPFEIRHMTDAGNCRGGTLATARVSA